jgi:hypothetical protein
LDALEKAEDTRIYNFPDFENEDLNQEPIYEEAKARKLSGKPFVKSIKSKVDWPKKHFVTIYVHLTN